jgi:hypothetical protein
MDEADNRLEAPEAGHHSFLVRLWEEAREMKGTEPFWRGSVEHVESGKKKYLQDLYEMIDFIVSYTGKRTFGPSTEKGRHPKPRAPLPLNLNLKGIRRLWRSAG